MTLPAVNLNVVADAGSSGGDIPTGTLFAVGVTKRGAVKEPPFGEHVVAREQDDGARAARQPRLRAAETPGRTACTAKAG